MIILIQIKYHCIIKMKDTWLDYKQFFFLTIFKQFTI